MLLFLVLLGFLFLSNRRLLDYCLILKIDVKHDKIRISLENIGIRISGLEYAQGVLKRILEGVRVVVEARRWVSVGGPAKFDLWHIILPLIRIGRLPIAILDEESVNIKLLIKEADKCKRGLVLNFLRHALFDELSGRGLRLSDLGPLNIKLILKLWACVFLVFHNVIFL